MELAFQFLRSIFLFRRIIQWRYAPAGSEAIGLRRTIRPALFEEGLRTRFDPDRFTRGHVEIQSALSTQRRVSTFARELPRTDV